MPRAVAELSGGPLGSVPPLFLYQAGDDSSAGVVQ